MPGYDRCFPDHMVCTWKLLTLFKPSSPDDRTPAALAAEMRIFSVNYLLKYAFLRGKTRYKYLL